MGLEVPPWAAQLFHVATGDAWPAADEDQIEDLARLWLSAGAELLRLAPEVTRSARYVADSGALAGDAQQALAAAVAMVTGDGDLTLEKLAAGFEELGAYLHQVALQTQYMKIIVVEQLIVLAAEIAYLLAMIPWTGGASAAGIAPLQLFGRQFAMTMLRRLATAIATTEVLQVGLDAVAQLAQIAQGRREGWDVDLTKSAAITGAVGLALGPVFQLVGRYPARQLGKALARPLGKDAAREAADWSTGLVQGALHEWVTDGAAGWVQNGTWNPAPFSLTAGALDQGVTGAGGRKGRRGIPAPGLSMNRIAGLDVPTRLDVDPAPAEPGVPQAVEPAPPAPAVPPGSLPTGGSRTEEPGSRPSIDQVLRGADQPAARSQATAWSVAASAVNLLSGTAPDDGVRSQLFAALAEQQSELGPDWSHRAAADPVVRGLLLVDAVDRLGRHAASGIPELRTAAAGHARTALTAPGTEPRATAPVVDRMTRAALTVVALGERSPDLAARLTTALFDALPQQQPVPEVTAAVNAMTTSLLHATPVAAARQAVAAVATAAAHVVAPAPIADAAPGSAPAASAGRAANPAVDAATASAPPPPGRAARWWHGLFDRPVSVAWPFGETLVEAPARSTVPPLPEYAPPPPAAEPVIAAAEAVGSRTRSLVERALADPPRLRDVPGRGVVTRAVAAALPWLGAASMRDVLTLHPASRRPFGELSPVTTSSVRDAARRRAHEVWPELTVAGAEPATRAPQRIEPVRHDDLLGGLMRTAAVERTGRTALADLTAARAEVHQHADSVSALQRSSRTVLDTLVEQRHIAAGDLPVARRDRIRAERSLEQAVLHEQVTRTALDQVSARSTTAPPVPTSAAVTAALRDDADAARVRLDAATRAWQEAQSNERALHEHHNSLTTAVDGFRDHAGRRAIGRAVSGARLAADTLDAAVLAASEAHRHEVRDVHRHEAGAVDALLRRPPGFPDDDSTAGLRSRLAQLQLELPLPASDAALPEVAVLRLVVDGLALVTGDPARAERALAVLMDHSLTELVPAPGSGRSVAESAESAEGLADARSLWRELAGTERGVEALALVARRHGSPLPGDALDALTVFWTADAASQARPADADDPTGSWLDAARRAAAHRIHGNPPAQVSDRERAAFNGVSNGLLAVGPGSTYENLNDWVHTLRDAWTRRAADRVQGVEAPFSDVVRFEGTTPLHPRLVREANRLGPAFGFSTRAVLADRATSAGADLLERHAQQRLTAALRAGRQPDGAELVAAAGAAWAAGLPEHGLARRRLTDADGPDLAVAAREQLGRAHETLARQGIPRPESGHAAEVPAAVRKHVAAAAARGDTALTALVGWASALAPPDGSRADAGLRAVKTELEEALRFGSDDGAVRDQSELVAFLDPVLADLDIRQGLRMVHGRAAGLAPPVPWYLRTLTRALTFGALPTVDAGYRKEVFLDVQYTSSLGIHISVGRQRAATAGFGVTLGGYVDLARRISLRLGLGLGARAGRATAEGLVLRVPRVRGRDAVTRTSAREVLDDLAFWDAATDEAGRPFDDPLQYILSRHQKLTVAPLDARQNTAAVDASLRAAVPVPVAGRQAQVAVGIGFERAGDRRRERSGRMRSALDHTSTATQRIRLGLGLPISVANQTLAADAPGGGELVNPTIAVPVSVTRELYRRQVRRRVNDMSTGRTGDADLDRVTDAPAAMLAETSANELGWIRRGVDTMEGVPAGLMPTFGRDLARARILRFRHDLQHLGRTSNYVGYTVRYSRQPQAQLHLDVGRSLATIAARRGDRAGAHRWGATLNTLLVQESTWQPRTVFARERGSRTRTRGLAVLVRAQTHEQVEVYRNAAQYPPP